MDNGSAGAHANVISRDYTGSQISQHLSRPAGGDSIVYIQTSPGSYALLEMPSLDGFKAAKGNVIIHKAEFSMMQLASPPAEQDGLLIAPPNLYMDYYDTDSLLQQPFLQDGFSNLTYSPSQVGGIQKYVTDPNGNLVSEYRFDLARYVQGIVTRNNKAFPVYLYSPYTVRYPTIFVSVPLNPIAYGRVKLGGGSLHAGQRMKLRIIYSKL
jgi:hypothetical protein